VNVARLQLLCNPRRNIGDTCAAHLSSSWGVSPMTFPQVVTADRVLKHGGHANQICQLCRTQRESGAAHAGSMLLLKLGVEQACPMDPNSAASSANKQLQTLQNVVDRHDGGGAKSTGRKHAWNI
jgi:hypothetical protein